MKRIILCLSLFAFFGSQAQQINPVPDYVFSNKMSVGRNAVTDTAAYFSIGPRYGAIRGMMPPMVTDTASMSATKRNGLLIFSIQKNKYLYWDSVGAKWAEMAGTAGSAITGSGVAGYIPKFTTTTNIANSNIYNSSGRVAINHTSPANPLHIYSDTASEVLRLEYKNTAPYISFYQKTTRLGYLQFDSAFGGLIQDETNMPLRFATSSTERMRIKADGELLLNTTLDAGTYQLQVAGSIYNTTGAVLAASSGNVGIGVTNPGYKLDLGSSNDVYARQYLAFQSFIGTGNDVAGFQIRTLSSTTNGIRFLNYAANQEYARMTSDGELLIGTTTDAGAYALQVAGSIYNTTGAVLAASSGSVGIGTTSPSYELDVRKTVNSGYVRNRVRNDGTSGLAAFYLETTGAQIHLLATSTDASLYSIGAHPLLFGTQNLNRGQFSADGEFYVGYTTDQGSYILQANGNALLNGNIRTAAPAGGTANDWRLGTVASVTPTSPNRTIEVSIGGTIYYIHAKTTND